MIAVLIAKAIKMSHLQQCGKKQRMQVSLAGQAGRIDAFLKRAHKWDCCKDIVTLNELLVKCNS